MILLRMRNDRALLKRLPIPEKTRGGIILPPRAVEYSQLCTLVAIGPWRKPAELVPGCLVLIEKYAGMRWWPDTHEEEEYLLVFTDEIIAWLEREAGDV